MTTKTLRLFFVLAFAGLLTACDKEPAPTVSYARDITPILAQNCQECHTTGGAGEVASGLTLTSHAGLMKGTKFGPVVKAGDSLSSTLVVLVEGRADPSLKMPHGNRPALSPQQIQLIRQWIDQGAKNN